jgi:hypothetical protein
MRLPTFELEDPTPELPVEELKSRLESISEACEQVKAGDVTPEEFYTFLEEYKASLPKPDQRLMIKERVGHATNILLEEVEDYPFAHFLKGIEIMMPFFNDLEEDLIDEAIQRLDDGLAYIEAGTKKLTDPASRTYELVEVPLLPYASEGRVLCVQCGHKNPSGPIFCSNCNARLPRHVMDSAIESKPELNGRLMRYKKNSDQVRRGQITADQFTVFLEQEVEALAEARLEYDQAHEGTDYRQTSPDEVASTKAGLDEFGQALDLMWLYLQEGNEINLDKAFALAKSGNQKLNNGLKMNAKVQEKLTQGSRYM